MHTVARGFVLTSYLKLLTSQCSLKPQLLHEKNAPMHNYIKLSVSAPLEGRLSSQHNITSHTKCEELGKTKSMFFTGILNHWNYFVESKEVYVLRENKFLDKYQLAGRNLPKEVFRIQRVFLQCSDLVCQDNHSAKG